MEVTKLKVTRREALGSNSMRHLRAAGQVPAVLYGHKQDPVALQASAHELAEVLGTHAQFMELDIEGATETAIIREIQYDAFGHEVLHLDFVRVSMDEQVEVPVAIELVGHAKGVAAGGVLEQHLMDITVRCRPGAIPEKIELRVDDLDVHDSICVKDVPLPEGATAVDDADKAVVAVVGARGGEDEAAGDGEEGAEPEVIGKKADDGE